MAPRKPIHTLPAFHSLVSGTKITCVHGFRYSVREVADRPMQGFPGAMLRRHALVTRRDNDKTRWVSQADYEAYAATAVVPRVRTRAKPA